MTGQSFSVSNTTKVRGLLLVSFAVSIPSELSKKKKKLLLLAWEGTHFQFLLIRR